VEMQVQRVGAINLLISLINFKKVTPSRINLQLIHYY
jgi:hypothetical protein